MKNKPIEPGCLAIIVGVKISPENNGRVVRVLRRSAAHEIPREAKAVASSLDMWIYPHPRLDPHEARWWVTPVNGTLLWRTRDRSLVVNCRERSYMERCLRRIDDGEDYSHETNEALSTPIGEPT